MEVLGARHCLLPETHNSWTQRTQRLLQEDAMGMAIAKSPLISPHSNSHLSACLFFWSAVLGASVSFC